jgi:hypothetical protein
MKEFEKDACQVAADFGIGEGLPFDKARADRAEQEPKRQYLTRSLARDRDHGDAAGAQPRQRHLHRDRGRHRRSTIVGNKVSSEAP